MTTDVPQILREPISLREVKEIAERCFGDMVKARVDIARGVIAIGGELHSDEEALLLDDGSRQLDVWGINIYPDERSDAWIEFDSMINVRPAQGNRSRGVDDPATQLEGFRCIGGERFCALESNSAACSSTKQRRQISART